MNLANKINAGVASQLAICRQKAADGTLQRLVNLSPFYAPDERGHNQNQYEHFRGHAYTAISAIARRIAGQPLHVADLSRVSRGPRTTKALDNFEAIPGHPLERLIDDPNPLFVRWELLFSTVCSLQLTGAAYWWFSESAEDRAFDIWPIPTHWLRPMDLLRRRYTMRLPSGEDKEISGEFIAYFKLPDPADPFRAMSPLQAQAATVDADELMQRSQLAQFRNAARPGAIIKAGKLPGVNGEPAQRPHLTAEQRQQLVAAIKRHYAGTLHHGEPIILDGLIEDIQPMPNPPEIDYLKSSDMTRNRIFQAFGVNPLIVGEIQGANRAQAVVAEESFCSNVTNPLLELLSQSLTQWVTPLFALNGEALKVWFEPCRPHDPELRIREHQLLASKGAITLNELRRCHGLPEIKGGDRLVSAGMASAARPPAIRDEARKALKGRDPYTLKPLE